MHVHMRLPCPLSAYIVHDTFKSNYNFFSLCWCNFFFKGYMLPLTLHPFLRLPLVLKKKHVPSCHAVFFFISMSPPEYHLSLLQVATSFFATFVTLRGRVVTSNLPE